MAVYEPRTASTRAPAQTQELRSGITSVSQEIARVRNSLDTNQLEVLLRSLGDLENTMKNLENEALVAGQQADQSKAELSREQERLKKLWDAYKAQEDEIARLKNQDALLLDREGTIQAQQRELQVLSSDLKRANDAMLAMENETNSLRETAVTPARYAEIEGQLDEERERLAKLYRVYEDVETDRARLEKSMRAWEDWFRSVRPSMEKLATAAKELPL